MNVNQKSLKEQDIKLIDEAYQQIKGKFEEAALQPDASEEDNLHN